jgi:SAM-dependent methyltransferase
MHTLLKAVLPIEVQQFLRQRLRQLGCPMQPKIPVEGYEVLTREGVGEPTFGWQDPDVAARQLAAFAPLLQQMRGGTLREDFSALVEAVRLTQMDRPLVVEVGCGSAWNREVLQRFSSATVRYVGLDYGREMLQTAHATYPGVAVLVGDACELPFRNGSIDILVSGTLLMHVLLYRKAIEESRRVSRRWCIFHTVPLLEDRETTILRKDAYGRPTIEIIFNRAELLGIFTANGLQVRAAIDSLPYDLKPVLGEATITKTFVCEVVDR